MHLGVLGWLQVGWPEAQPSTVLAPVQTRQILTQPTLATPPTQSLKELPKRPAEPVRRERLPRREVAPLAVPAAVANAKVTEDTATATSVAEESAPAAGSGQPQTTTATAGELPATAQGGSSKGVTLPSSMADYLSNPPPTYPALSLRLNEQGKVVVRVLIGKNGRALDARIAHTSGFDRLDQAALRAVQAWRYVPGTVDGQAQDMWFDVPVNFKPPR